MRIVFIVGADRAGKTTLTDEFRRRGWIYRHFDPPKGSPYAEYLGFAKWLSEEGNPDGKYVVDRYMYCEFAYSAHYGRGTDMTIGRMHEIEDILLRLDPHAAVVHCETDLRSNWERIEAEGKNEFRTIGQLETLRAEYARVLSQSRLDVVRYDFTAGDTPKATVSEIEKGT